MPKKKVKKQQIAFIGLFDCSGDALPYEPIVGHRPGVVFKRKNGWRQFTVPAGGGRRIVKKKIGGE